MKKTLALAATLTALALTAVAVGAEQYAPAKGSSVKIEGTSTLHAWTMEGSTINGTIKADSPASANVAVAIPVTSIRSEHTKMDKLMADALKARDHPEVRYEMTQATPQGSGDAFTIKTRGKLTIAGVTRDIAMDVQAVKNADGRYTLTGSTPLRMTAFGIKPPTAMLGTVKTGDDVKVTFRWVVEKAK
ncbi:MAG TPA: YceI family protein [Thermoanaerobaculia bacterium]|jgi:polyisoprenoid-binding protein YceI